MQHSQLTNISSYESNFANAKLSYSTIYLDKFYNCALDNANLSNSNIPDSHFSRRSLEGVNVDRANISKSTTLTDCKDELKQSDLARDIQGEIDVTAKITSAPPTEQELYIPLAEAVEVLDNGQIPLAEATIIEVAEVANRLRGNGVNLESDTKRNQNFYKRLGDRNTDPSCDLGSEK